VYVDVICVYHFCLFGILSAEERQAITDIDDRMDQLIEAIRMDWGKVNLYFNDLRFCNDVMKTFSL